MELLRMSVSREIRKCATASEDDISYISADDMRQHGTRGNSHYILPCGWGMRVRDGGASR